MWPACKAEDEEGPGFCISICSPSGSFDRENWRLSQDTGEHHRVRKIPHPSQVHFSAEYLWGHIKLSILSSLKLVWTDFQRSPREGKKNTHIANLENSQTHFLCPNLKRTSDSKSYWTIARNAAVKMCGFLSELSHYHKLLFGFACVLTSKATCSLEHGNK